MKFIGKLILYVLIALLVVILGLYFLLQTRWGAEHISAWISEHSDYQLSFEAMDHRFSSPSHILLKNVTFGRDGQPATLVYRCSISEAQPRFHSVGRYRFRNRPD